MSSIQARKWYIWRIRHRNICLKCRKWITTEVSHRRFCLECNIDHTKVIRALKALKLNFLFVFKELSV